MNPAPYEKYSSLTLKRHPEGILEIIMGAPGKLAAQRILKDRARN